MDKRDVYFSINECTEEELNQLRWALYYDESDINDIFDEKDIEILDGCSCPEEIPFEILEKVYGNISFVDEDFWCNCKEEAKEEEVKPERKKSDEIDEYYFLILEQFN